MTIQLIRVAELDSTSITHLVEESLVQGFRMVARLVQEFDAGINRFDRPNECLWVASSDERIVGIGGLNQDPYSNNLTIGRVRHLYVEAAWRRRGVGRLLVNQIITVALEHYQQLTLRTDTVVGDRFYQQLGFQRTTTLDHTTHYLNLSELVNND
ncbi:MAG TPA: GNAT family N-acetyltransferase [Crinalium sp.]|jgi:GNAT superfamily N-acetyltransferase